MFYYIEVFQFEWWFDIFIVHLNNRTRALVHGIKLEIGQCAIDKTDRARTIHKILPKNKSCGTVAKVGFQERTNS